MSREFKSQCIVALDFPEAKVALDFLKPLQNHVQWVKVGLELFVAAGPALLTELHQRGHQIFLDLKLHDIPKTMERTLQRLAHYPIALTTIHYSAGPTCLQHLSQLSLPFTTLGVTALTSLTQNEISQIYGSEVNADLLLEKFLGHFATSSFPGGCIASGQEVVRIRTILRKNHREDFLIVCPGVRFDANKASDQARISHPFETLQKGADFVVIGRELTQASDPLNLWKKWESDYVSTFN